MEVIKSQDSANKKTIFPPSDDSVFYILASAVVECDVYPRAIPGTAGTLSEIDACGSNCGYNSAEKESTV